MSELTATRPVTTPAAQAHLQAPLWPQQPLYGMTLRSVDTGRTAPAPSRLLAALAIILWVAAFVAGFIVDNAFSTDESIFSATEFNSGAALAVWIGGFVQGAVFLALGSIAKSVQAVKDSLS